MHQSELRKQLIERFGPAKFNKFLRSLPDAREKGRLFFWQEEFTHEVRAAGIDMPEKLGAILAHFSGQEIANVPLSREAFLATPLEYWGRSDFDIPSTWIEEAARQPAVRDSLFYSLSRSASKVGDFSLATEALSLLARQLSPEEAVELYCYIRDNSQRLEEEWRPEFEDAFPDSEPLLPEMEEWYEDPEAS